MNRVKGNGVAKGQSLGKRPSDPKFRARVHAEGFLDRIFGGLPINVILGRILRILGKWIKEAIVRLITSRNVETNDNNRNVLS